MSHFSVLVIGADHAKQLQPFHEFECTGTNDEFVQDVDVTEECREHGLDYHGLEDAQVADESEVDRDGEHRYGYAVVKDGVLIKAVNRTNPNRKWDWWEIGGRWQGKLLLKPGRTGESGRAGLMGSRHPNGGVDQALKGDVDFDKMRDQAGERAGAEYDQMAAIIAGRSWDSWQQVVERNGGYNEAARAEYNAQPVVVDYKASPHYYPMGAGIDAFRCSREEYVQAARDGAIATFAIVKDGQWYQRGEMGWWGAVSDRKDDAEWNREFSALVDGLPDDTLLTMVDCHI